MTEDITKTGFKSFFAYFHIVDKDNSGFLEADEVGGKDIEITVQILRFLSSEMKYIDFTSMSRKFFYVRFFKNRIKKLFCLF